MPRRVGRYTKYETSELLRMFDEGYSVYKICRTLNRSQKSIRNNLIRQGKIEGEITPRRTITKDEVMTIQNEGSRFVGNAIYGLILSALTCLFIVEPQFNILEILLIYFFINIVNFINLLKQTN